MAQSTQAPAASAEAPPVIETPVVRARDTVTVACKLPNGIVLRAFDMVDAEEAAPSGQRTVKRAQQREGTCRIRGNALDLEQVKRDPENIPPMSMGFALTHDVPRDLWENWLEANRQTEMVKNGLIFAHGEEASLRAMASERRGVRTGMEPINPDSPARTTGVTQIERGERIST